MRNMRQKEDYVMHQMGSNSKEMIREESLQGRLKLGGFVSAITNTTNSNS